MTLFGITMDDGSGTHTEHHDYKRADMNAAGKPGTRTVHNGPGIETEVAGRNAVSKATVRRSDPGSELFHPTFSEYKTRR